VILRGAYIDVDRPIAYVGHHLSGGNAKVNP